MLVACECSGTVRDAFIKKGHIAMSCDLQDTVTPGPHYKGDVFDVINDGWDLMIAHPPCTHLAVSGAAHFAKKRADGRQQQGIDLFMRFTTVPIKKWAIENPIGIMSKLYRKPDQIIQPYHFGDPFSKSTCLWLKGLNPLFHNGEPTLFGDPITHTHSGEWFEWIDKKTGKKKRQPMWFKDAWNLPPEERANVRSKTFPGIANAMAEQWG